MTNASIRNTFSVLSVFALAVALSMGAFAIIAHAQEDLGYADTYGDNFGYADTYGSNLGYADTYGTNLGYADTYGTNLGYADTYGTNLGYADTYGSNLGYVDTYGTNLGYADTYGNNNVWDAYDVYDTYDTYAVYQDGVGYSYSPNYGYGGIGGGYGAGGYGGSSGSGFSLGLGFEFGSGRNKGCGYDCYALSSPSYFPSYTQQSGAQPINIVNSNNSNLNSTTSVFPVAQTPVTYPVQYVYSQYSQPTYQSYPIYTPTYTYPTYTPTYGNVYCTITASPGSIANGQTAYLTWSAPGATSAWLSDGIGAVSTNGSLAVRPNFSKTYTLTVSGYNSYSGYSGYGGYIYGSGITGQGGTNTCSTYVTVSGIAAPYVALSQIPYTGFDFGPVGNTLYWLSLLSFAVASAYLLVYYKGGAMVLAHATAGLASQLIGRNVSTMAGPVKSIEKVVVKTAQKIDTIIEPVISSFQNLPFSAKASEGKPVMGTSDAMKLIHSQEGTAPRIVITRN